MDLWGRLANPPDTPETVPEQGLLVEPAGGRKPQKATHRSANRPGAAGPDDKGRHSNPGSRTLRTDVDSTASPTTGEGAGRPAKPVQRRMTPSELAAIAVEYQHGRSLDDLAREFGVDNRTVAGRLESLGVTRRVNLPKLTSADIEQAVSLYQTGDSLATVGKVLKVDASTVQRTLKRASVAIRPRRGC